MTRNRHIQLLTIEYAANARGVVKTHSYEQARGLLLGTTYSDGTTARAYSYNHLGQLTQVVDDAGTRTIGYNAYNEQEADSLVVDGDTHLITETRDRFGRSTGYTYAKNGTVQQTVTTGYGDDGRISSAGFLHGGAEKNFGYTYLAGTNLLQVLTKPNGMTLTQTYEANRNLTTGIAYHRGSSLVAQRTYTYDILGRPTARNTARQGAVVNDTFAHNTRSELVEATVSGKNYEYAYDNIGNRKFSLEDGKASMYDANSLNQYSSIAVNGGTPFIPQFDADGNQTLIKTSTGIWSAVYNAENRPVIFTNSESNTVVECQYDSLGRRAYKKVTVNGEVTLHQRYIYRGYLQIAALDLNRSPHPALWFITWDPIQPVATRPLAIQINGTWFTYGWDLTKNICELYSTSGSISTSYTYTPFGKVTATGSLSQPIQWSCEVWDSELRLVYYNWRYYNPLKGRWFEQDSIPFSTNEYIYCRNSPLILNDLLGQVEIIPEQKGQKSNCLGGAMTGKKGEYRYPVPGKGEAKKVNFIQAMEKHNWDCYKVNMYQECLCESDTPKILISLWKAKSSYYKNRNPWTDHTFPWNRNTVDLHAIRTECGTSHDYVEIPRSSTEIQEFQPVTDFSLFSSDHHLLCCCYINNQKKTSKKKTSKKKKRKKK